MWIPERFKHLGSVDIGSALAALKKVDENLWYENDDLKQRLAGDRPTQSLFFYNIGMQQFNEILSKRPLKQQDIPKLAAYEALYEEFSYLFEFLLHFYPKGGVIARAQLARMQPGSEITEHYDHLAVLVNSHRLHIPIVTNNKLRFIIDNELVRMEAGNLYELNNQVLHSVENPKDAKARIHLIIDYLPPEHNNPAALDVNFKFKIKQERAKKIIRKPLENLPLPKIIATSVVRGANQNESHGGIYLVDLKTDKVDQVIDWDTCDIDFSGRGWDRGLRGIAFVDNYIIVAASDELFFYDRKFNVKARYKNRYLRHAHEIMIDGRFLYVASTGFDAVLRFNFRKKKFDLGWKLFLENNLITVAEFDPAGEGGPDESNVFHINNAFYEKGRLYFSGRQLRHLLMIVEGKVLEAAQVPAGTHNVYHFAKGIVYNDTESNQAVYSSNYDYRVVPVSFYENEKITHREFGDDRLARQGFGRGLCKYLKGTVVVGSSPSTVTLIDFKNADIIKSVNISMDVRNAIHGLELWPF